MGYCTYAGKLVPGGDAAGCIGGGGDWVDTEHTPSYGPGDGQKRGFITPASGWDLSSSSQLGSHPMDLPTRPIGTSYGMGQGVQRSFLEPGLGYPDTDDFGNPLSTDFEGNTNFGLLRDKAVKKHNINAFNNEGIYYDGDTDDFGRPMDTNFEGESNFGLLRDRAVDKFNVQPYRNDYPYNKKVNSTKTDAGRDNLIETIMQAHNVDRDKARMMSSDDNIVSGLSEKLASNYKSQFQPVTGLFTGTGFTKDGKVVVKSDLENMGLGNKINMAVEDVYAIPIVGDVAEFLNPSSDLGSLVTTMTDPELRNEAIEFIKQNPKTATVSALTAYFASKSKKIRNAWKWATQRWQSSYPINSPQGLNASQIMTDVAAIYYGGKGIASVTNSETGIQTEPFVQSLMSDGSVTDPTTGDKINEVISESQKNSTADGLLKPNKPNDTGGPIGPSDINNLFQPSDKPRDSKGKGKVDEKSFFERIQTSDYWKKSMSSIPGDTRLQRLIDEMRYASFTDKQKSTMGKSPADKRREAALKQQEIGGKAIAAKLKADATNKGYQWKAKEIETYASSYFDDYFGIDFPGGKDKDIERARFIAAVADSKRMVENKNTPLEKVIQAVLAKGGFR